MFFLLLPEPQIRKPLDRICLLDGYHLHPFLLILLHLTPAFCIYCIYRTFPQFPVLLLHQFI
jgi:hypothetical protein